MLRAAGMDEAEERAYRLLIRSPGASQKRLADQLGIAQDELARTLKSLQEQGLARRTGNRYDAIAPDLAIGPLLLRRQEDLDQARQAVQQLTEEYLANARRRSPGQVVEVLASRDALREQLRALQDNARSEVVCFCRAGHVVMTSQENTEELDALRRGVGYRSCTSGRCWRSRACSSTWPRASSWASRRGRCSRCRCGW